MANVARDAYDGDRLILRRNLKEYRQKLKKARANVSFINLRASTLSLYEQVDRALELMQSLSIDFD